MTSPNSSSTDELKSFTVPEWLKEFCALLVVVGFCLFMVSSFWQQWNLISDWENGDPDGLVQQSYVVPLVEGFWKFREFPLWNPYFGGGMPWSGYVYNPGISLITPIYVKFGVISGIKVWCALVLCLGALGLYWCCRGWGGCSRPWAVAGAVVYAGNLWVPLQMDSGNYDLLMLHALPLYAVLFKGLLERRWYGLLLPVLFQTSFAQAKYAPFVAGAFLLLLAIMWAGLNRKRLVLAVGLVLAASTAGALISMPKLLPLWQMFSLDRVNQSEMAEQFTLSYRSFEDYVANLSGYQEPLRSYNHVGGIGWFPLLAAWVGLGLNPKRARLFLGPLVVFSLICLGDYSPIPLSKILRELPLFNTMFSFPKYWLNGVLAAYCVLMAMALQEVDARIVERQSWKRFLFLVFAVLLLVGSFKPLMNEGRQLLAKHFVAFAIRTTPDEFYQVSTRTLQNKITRYRTLRPGERVLEGEQLQNILSDVGTITWYGNLIFEEAPQPKFFIEEDKSITENPDYRGEIYLENSDESATISNYHFTFNTQNFQYESAVPVTVVINQNWNPEWSASLGKAVETRGLLSVELPAGSGDVKLQYSSWRFTMGLVIALLSAVAWLAWGIWWVRKGPRVDVMVHLEAVS